MAMTGETLLRSTEELLRVHFLRYPRSSGAHSGASTIAWSDVVLCNLSEGCSRERPRCGLARYAYVMFHENGVPLGWLRGAEAAAEVARCDLERENSVGNAAAEFDAEARARLQRTRDDPAGASPTLRPDWLALEAVSDADAVAESVPQSAAAPSLVLPLSHHFYVHGSRGTTEKALEAGRVSVRPGTRLGAYVDACLELYEMLHVERLLPSSPEYVRRCAAMHARLFDLGSESGRCDDAAALAALPHIIVAQPHLEQLVRATLGRLLVFRLDYLFGGEERLAHAASPRSTILEIGDDADGDINDDDDGKSANDEELHRARIQLYSSIASPRYCKHVEPNGAPVKLVRSEEAENDALRDEVRDAISSFGTAAQNEDVVRRHIWSIDDALSRFDALEALDCEYAERLEPPRERRSTLRCRVPPRALYLVSAQRDASDAWLLAEASGGRVAPPTAVHGWTWVTYRELSRCVARRTQSAVWGALRRLRETCQLVGRLSGFFDVNSPLPAYRPDVVGTPTMIESAARNYISRLRETVDQRTDEAAAAAAAARRSGAALGDSNAARLVSAHVASMRAAYARLCASAGERSARRDFVVDFVFNRALLPIADAAATRLLQVRQHIMRGTAFSRVQVPRGVEATPYTFYKHALEAMPPCLMHIVREAVPARDGVQGQHPRYMERIRLALFLFHAGWSFDRALVVWQYLFALSNACPHARGTTAQFARDSKYARTLEGLYNMYVADILERDGAPGASGGAGEGVRNARDMEIDISASAMLGGEQSAVAAAATTTAVAPSPAPAPRPAPAETRSGGPASCTTMCRGGMCPLYSESPDASFVRRKPLVEMLSNVRDIEDALRPVGAIDLEEHGSAHLQEPVRRAQVRCSRIYRSLRRGDDRAVRHPLLYYQHSLEWLEAARPDLVAAEASRARQKAAFRGDGGAPNSNDDGDDAMNVDA